MIRLLIIALCVFGAHMLFSRTFPVQAASVAFTVGGVGITYLIIGCVVSGCLAYKFTRG